MKLRRDKADAYLIELGTKTSIADQPVPCRFALGTNRERAEQLAAKLVQLFEVEGPHWSKDAYRRALAIFK